MAKSYLFRVLWFEPMITGVLQAWRRVVCTGDSRGLERIPRKSYGKFMEVDPGDPSISHQLDALPPATRIAAGIEVEM